MVVNTTGEPSSLAAGRLDNPVIPASGTFGFGYEFRRVVRHQHPRHLLLQGHHAGSALWQPHARASPTRPPAMLNAVGLQNPGVRRRDRARSCPGCRTVFHKPVIANVSGFSVEEYARTAARVIDREEQVGLIGSEHLLPQRAAAAAWPFGTSPEMRRRGDARR